jgi:DNA helicase HerA-like ATPase
VPATLDAGGFDRHTFLCGQSGSGKTYSLGLALERLLVETDLRLVILDPNSDYVRSESSGQMQTRSWPQASPRLRQGSSSEAPGRGSNSESGSSIRARVRPHWRSTRSPTERSSRS